MGELGWTSDRYRCSSIYEFNKASAGYWRNWERQTAWLMREIVYTLIAGNPYITENKPTKDQIMKLSIDGESKENKVITQREAKKIEKQFINNI